MQSTARQVYDSDVHSAFAENQFNFSEFSEHEGDHQISKVYLESQSDSCFLSSKDNARYNNVWLLLSMLDSTKETESIRDIFAPSVTNLSSLMQCANLLG
jgi:hypothetical protein